MKKEALERIVLDVEVPEGTMECVVYMRKDFFGKNRIIGYRGKAEKESIEGTYSEKGLGHLVVNGEKGTAYSSGKKPLIIIGVFGKIIHLRGEIKQRQTRTYQDLIREFGIKEEYAVA